MIYPRPERPINPKATITGWGTAVIFVMYNYIIEMQATLDKNLANMSHADCLEEGGLVKSATSFVCPLLPHVVIRRESVDSQAGKRGGRRKGQAFPFEILCIVEGSASAGKRANEARQRQPRSPIRYKTLGRFDGYWEWLLDVLLWKSVGIE